MTIPIVSTPKLIPSEISGKIILKKKSGPGEMIGNTEITIFNGSVKFEGIQFDEAGDYVISVTSTSPDVDSFEFSLKVLPEAEVIPQDEVVEKESVPVTGSRPIIAQIDNTTIVLPPIKIDKPDGESNTTLIVDSIGLMPFVSYNGATIQDRDIISFKLYHDGIIPKLNLTFNDTLNLIKTNSPQDDTKIEIFLNSKSDNLKSIHLKFKIEKFKKNLGETYNIIGTLDISDLYRIQTKSYTGTSFEVLRKISIDLGLGFNSNIQNTTDSMSWRMNNQRPYEFISDVINHSYISDTSYMSGYIDYYYCFNYVDVEKEMTRDNTSDVGVETGDGIKVDSDEKLFRLSLTNEPSSSKSTFYYEDSSKKITNNASKTGLEEGYSTINKSYDSLSKVFQVFKIDGTTSNGDKSIILKGSNGDKESFDNNVTTKYTGRLDVDNVHKNYMYAVTQNERNLTDMEKLVMNISLPNTNFNLYKYQKLYVNVINMVISPSDTNRIIYRENGDWFLVNISYIFREGRMTQDLMLVRKEADKTPDEIANTTKESIKETKDEINENPTVDAKANDIYEIGDIYTVKDKNGIEYTLIIKSLSDDGNEIFGNIKEN